jgi:hypothetical protein
MGGGCFISGGFDPTMSRGVKGVPLKTLPHLKGGQKRTKTVAYKHEEVLGELQRYGNREQASFY